MYTVTKYPQGTFSWADSVSTDSEKAKEFYMGLFGWDKEEFPMNEGTTYTIFKQDGSDVAALSPMSSDMQKQGVPSHWNNYITVDDVSAMAETVKMNGGTVVVAPFDVFDSGRMMVIQDPTGATVCFWQAKNHIGAGLVNVPGAMGWNELATRDLEKAKDFFHKVLGWEYQVDEKSDYTIILNNGRMNGGMMQMDERWGDAPPNWTVYFNVADLDDTLKKVPELDGKIVVDKTETPAGPFAVISDPAGAVISIIQSEQYDEWIE